MHGVRVLIAPDSFGSSLTADEAAEAIAGAWRAVGAARRGDARARCPTGARGSSRPCTRALGGELVPVDRDVAASARPSRPCSCSSGRPAYVESAQAVGLPARPGRPPRPDAHVEPRRGRAASRRRVDAGATPGRRRASAARRRTTPAPARWSGWRARSGSPGLAHALGARRRALGAVDADDLAGLRELRDRLRGVELVVATDVDVPLLGLHGASAGFAPQKGATPEQAQDLERALGDFAHAATAALGDALRPDLLAGARAASATSRLTAAPGAGAAGGLGFGLALLGGRLVPGVGVRRRRRRAGRRASPTQTSS